MPELPEVETLARGLRKYVVGEIILRPRFVHGKKVTGISRRAKWLIIHLSSKDNFVVHLKMTGQLLYQNGGPIFLGGHTMGLEQTKLPNNHTRFEFEFTDKTKLFFQDMRKFGYIKLYSNRALEHYFAEKKLGFEPLDKDFTFDYFNTQLKRHGNTSIKAVLLNQSCIAGIGNIYADDVCWQAKVKPTRRVGTLTRAEQHALHQASRTILLEAIKLGCTSFSHYYRVDGKTGFYWNKRKVYDRAG